MSVRPSETVQLKAIQHKTMELEENIAPPMANGELLFDAPWQGRTFGIVRVLCESGLFSWDEFRESLIDRIGRWDDIHREDEPYAYYDHVLVALTNLLSVKGICDIKELIGRDEEFHARPHGHDH